MSGDMLILFFVPKVEPRLPERAKVPQLPRPKKPDADYQHVFMCFLFWYLLVFFCKDMFLCLICFQRGSPLAHVRQSGRPGRPIEESVQDGTHSDDVSDAEAPPEEEVSKPILEAKYLGC